MSYFFKWYMQTDYAYALLHLEFVVMKIKRYKSFSLDKKHIVYIQSSMLFYVFYILSGLLYQYTYMPPMKCL